MPVFLDRYGIEKIRVIDCGTESTEIDRFKSTILQIDHVYLLLGILLDLFCRDFWTELGMAQWDHPRIVRTHPVDRSGSETQDEPDQPLILLDLWVPGVKVTRKHDPRGKGEKVISEATTNNLLNHHGHPLIEVEQPMVATIEDGIRSKNASKNSLDGRDKVFEPRLQISLIRHKDGQVFSREGQAKVVFQEAGRTNDDRVLTDFAQNPPEVVDNLRRKSRILEILLNLQVLLFDRLSVLILMGVKEIQVVSINELREDTGV